MPLHMPSISPSSRIGGSIILRRAMFGVLLRCVSKLDQVLICPGVSPYCFIANLSEGVNHGADWLLRRPLADFLYLRFLPFLPLRLTRYFTQCILPSLPVALRMHTRDFFGYLNFPRATGANEAQYHFPAAFFLRRRQRRVAPLKCGRRALRRRRCEVSRQERFTPALRRLRIDGIPPPGANCTQRIFPLFPTPQRLQWAMMPPISARNSFPMPSK